MGYVFYYLEAEFACFCLLAIILHRMKVSTDKQLSQVLLSKVVITVMLYFACEMLWCLVDSGTLWGTRRMVLITNVITYIVINIAAYLWFLFSESLQKNKVVEHDTARLLIGIPAWIATFLIILGYRIGIVFYFDSDGVLRNGQFYSLLIIIPFMYIVAASILAFYRASRKDKYADHDIYMMIGIFPVAPVIFGTVQAIYWRVPTLCFAATGAILFAYLSMQQSLITIDPLTQTNNRNQLNRFLVNKLANPTEGLSLFIMIIDIDNLRSINLKEGRLEGDMALIRVSQAIKQAADTQRNRFFVSRYENDKFVVVAEVEYKAEINWISDQIRSNCAKLNSEAGALYPLTVSIGVAQYDYSMPLSIQAILARADSNLYQQKKVNKSE